MPRILIVDDEPDMRLAVRNVLRLRGYEISEAGDGPSALKLARENRPDLVLLDMRLPGMDGIEVLGGLKEMDETLPVVMLTGYGHIRSAADVMKLGASECLQKPFENAQLVETVRKFAHGVPRTGTLRAGTAKTSEAVPAAAMPLRQPAFPAVRRRPVHVIAAALFALLAGAAAVWHARISAASYFREYNGVAANISALVWAEGKLYAGDWLAQSVHVYSKGKDGLRLERSYLLQKTHISGLAVAGGTLYVADSWKKTVEARALAPGLPLLKVFPMPGKVTALFYDGEYLWTCDAEGNAVLRRPDPELAPAVSFRLAEKPDQIFKDDKYLWTAVSSEGKFYRHKLDGALSLDGVFVLKNYRAGYPLSAFAWHEGRLWLARDGLGVVSEAGGGELTRER